MLQHIPHLVDVGLIHLIGHEHNVLLVRKLDDVAHVVIGQALPGGVACGTVRSWQGAERSGPLLQQGHKASSEGLTWVDEDEGAHSNAARARVLNLLSHRVNVHAPPCLLTQVVAQQLPACGSMLVLPQTQDCVSSTRWSPCWMRSSCMPAQA